MQYAPTGTRPNSPASADARMRYAPTRVRSFGSLHVPGQTSPPRQGPSVDARMRYAPTGTRPNLAGIPDALSALLSDSIFAAVFGDAKSDGPVRDVKRESSERLEQCPLL